MDAQPRTIDANGTELVYVEQGDGETVVFVHGSLSDFRSWGLQMAPFAQRYRTIAYSRRGH
jgi:non-heme chloroperoxidase